jgi:hypothetical protein
MTQKENIEKVTIHKGDSVDFYDAWGSPVVIVSDGAYGVDGFESDPSTREELKDWYRPHVRKWSEKSTPQTTLWFWNTEVGWAEVHPLLEAYGWEYRGTNIWDKGIRHISGNSNTQKLRKFPQVTEVCVQYVKKASFDVGQENYSMQEWLRHEWERSGLNLYEANEACGVSNAASRKYLTKDDEWYFPPPDSFVKMAEYANKHGDKSGRPYFEIKGKIPTRKEWKNMRAKFDCPSGVTNVWNEPPLHSDERVKNDEDEYIHLNQKPRSLINRIIKASSDENDTVWSPFTGLCTTGVVCNEIERRCFASEIVDSYYKNAVERLKKDIS